MAIAFVGLLFTAEPVLNELSFFLVFAVLIDTFIIRRCVFKCVCVCAHLRLSPLVASPPCFHPSSPTTFSDVHPVTAPCGFALRVDAAQCNCPCIDAADWPIQLVANPHATCRVATLSVPLSLALYGFPLSC